MAQQITQSGYGRVNGLNVGRGMAAAIPALCDMAPRMICCADGHIVVQLALARAARQEHRYQILIGVHSDYAVRAEEYLHMSGEAFQSHD